MALVMVDQTTKNLYRPKSLESRKKMDQLISEYRVLISAGLATVTELEIAIAQAIESSE